MKEDEDYFISLVQFEQEVPDIPTKTSDLINDGEDGVHPFITAEDVPTPTLQSVTDQGDTTTTTVYLNGGALSDSTNEQALFQPDLISTVNKNTGSGVELSSTGYVGISPDGVVGGYFAAEYVTEDVTLQVPNKPTGTYFISTVEDLPTKTSDLTNDGSDGVNPFITAADIPPVTGYVPYTGATANVDLGEYELKAGQVEFDQTPTGTAGVGVMRWNDSDGTVDLGLKGGNVTLQIGQESVLRVVNKTATNINLLEANYQAVRVTGAQGQRLKIDLAQATNDNLSAETIGLVTETINNNQEGFITTSGIVRGINTTGSLQGETWADGDILYLSPTTAGRATKVKPTAPNHLVILGYVIHAHANQGSIFVKVDNGYELDELHNVKITSAANNNVLAYTSATDIWENKTVETALGYTPFQLPALTSGSVLFSNGTTIAQKNAQLFWDNTNNRLGIGTNAPTSKIHADIIESTLSTNSEGLLLKNSGTNATANGTLFSPSLSFDSSASSGSGAYLPLSWKVFSSGSPQFPNVIGRLSFSSSVNGSTLTERAYIRSTGEFGATSVVTGSLTMNTNGLTTSSGLSISGFNVNQTINSAGNFSLNSSFIRVFGNTGNVLINTTTDAGFKLDVNGTARVQGNLNMVTGNAVHLTTGFTGTGGNCIYSLGSATFLINNRNVCVANFYNGGSDSNQGIQFGIGIGTGQPPNTASAILDLTSTTKGFLPPRMTTTQKNAIATPAAGLVVYDTTLGKLCVRGAAAWETITSI
jgi:hypothetical protein